MKKILLISNTDWYLHHFRLPLANTLRDQGFEVVFVSPPGKYAPMIKSLGFRWVGWRLGRRTLTPWSELSSTIELARILRREHPDLIHNHTIKPVIYGSLATRLAGCDKVVNSITGRGFIFVNQATRTRLLKLLVRIMYRIALNHAGFVTIFENETDREYFNKEKIIKSRNTYLIPGMGVDTDYFKPVPEPEGITIILYSGRLLWDKGVGTLVDAAHLLHQRTPVRVALVGQPDPGNPTSIPESTIRNWVSVGLVEWWGWREDMNIVYQSSHIVTLPSMGEGIPTSLLEAAACGKPLVASDVPGCRDVVQHNINGILVPAGDPAALAGALYQLVSKPELRGKMGLVGRQFVLQHFTTSIINSQTIAVYQEMLKPNQIN
jgi:glycosyltransferase involved in cell wall biosynthesis